PLPKRDPPPARDAPVARFAPGRRCRRTDSCSPCTATIEQTLLEVDDMPRARQTRNGRLEEALATLLQTQASTQQSISASQQNISELQHNLTAFLAHMAEMKVESDRRFARIEAILLDHTRILQEHTRILEALPEAVRERIGFKIPEQRG